jgi:hypothetical protein
VSAPDTRMAAIQLSETTMTFFVALLPSYFEVGTNKQEMVSPEQIHWQRKGEEEFAVLPEGGWIAAQ